MKKLKKWMLLLTICLLVSLMAMPASVNAAAKLNKKNVTLTVKKTYKLKVSGTKQKIKWASSNRKIATVSSKGVVKAVKAGKCTITAKYGKKKLTCKVTVKKAVKKPATNPVQKNLLTELREGFTAQLIIPSVGTINSCCQVKYTNNTGHVVNIQSMVYANGKGCMNQSLLQSSYALKDGYYAVVTYSCYPSRPDMYLDNYSTAWTNIRVDGTSVVVKFDVKGNSEFGYKPQDVGIY